MPPECQKSRGLWARKRDQSGSRSSRTLRMQIGISWSPVRSALLHTPQIYAFRVCASFNSALYIIHRCIENYRLHIRVLDKHVASSTRWINHRTYAPWISMQRIISEWQHWGGVSKDHFRSFCLHYSVRNVHVYTLVWMSCAFIKLFTDYNKRTIDFLPLCQFWNSPNKHNKILQKLCQSTSNLFPAEARLNL